MRTVLRQTFLFAFAEGMTRGADLVLLPLYTALLKPSEYGRWALALSLVLVLRPIVTLGLQGGILRYYFRFEGPERGGFLVAVLSLAGIAGIVGVGVMSLAAVLWPEQALLGLRFSPTMQLVMASVLTGAVLFDLPREMLRAGGEATAMVFGSAAWLPTQGVAVWAFCGWLGLGADGALMGLMASHVANAIVVAAVIRPTPGRPSFRGLGTVVAFSLPMIPHFLAHWVLAFSDRFLLAAYRSLDEVAVYNVGYLVGSVIALPKVALTSVMIPRYGAVTAKRSNAEAERIAAMTSTYAFSIFAVGIAVAVVVPPAIGLFLSDAYASSVPVAAVVLLASVVLALYNPSANVLTIVVGKSGRLGLLTTAAAFSNVGLNMLLIPRTGVIGAAAATLATYTILSAGALFMAHRSWRLPYPFLRLFAGMIVFASTVGVRMLYMPPSAGVLSSGGLGIAGLVLLVAVMRPRLSRP